MDVWRCAITTSGVQSVMISGASTTPTLLAGNSAMPPQVLHCCSLLSSPDEGMRNIM